MSGPEIVAEVNAMSASTWDSKVLNIQQLLDQNGYLGMYVLTHTGSRLELIFQEYDAINNVNIPLKTFVVDLSADTTHRQILTVIDDYFGEFENDRSYDWENDKGPNL